MRFPFVIIINSLALLLCLICAITTKSISVFVMEIIFIILNAFCIVVNVITYRRNKWLEKKNQN